MTREVLDRGWSPTISLLRSSNYQNLFECEAMLLDSGKADLRFNSLRNQDHLGLGLIIRRNFESDHNTDNAKRSYKSLRSPQEKSSKMTCQVSVFRLTSLDL